MFKTKFLLLVLLLFISHSFYAQNSSNFFLGDAFNPHVGTLSTEQINDNENVSNNIIDLPAISERRNLPIKVGPNSGEQEFLRDTRIIREDHRGLNWSIGYGFGFSSHASSYFIDEGFRIKNFSGIRSIVLASKIGWGFHENIVLFGTWQYAPGNSTISPYQSNYFGGTLAYYFYKLSIHGGLGTFQSKLGKNRIAGKGLLMNWGIMLQPAPSFAFELSLLTGKMEPGNVAAYLSESTEYNFTLGVAYTF